MPQINKGEYRGLLMNFDYLNIVKWLLQNVMTGVISMIWGIYFLHVFKAFMTPNLECKIYISKRHFQCNFKLWNTCRKQMRESGSNFLDLGCLGEKSPLNLSPLYAKINPHTKTYDNFIITPLPSYYFSV